MKKSPEEIRKDTAVKLHLVADKLDDADPTLSCLEEVERRLCDAVQVVRFLVWQKRGWLEEIYAKGEEEGL